jgi:hypothetical protein
MPPHITADAEGETVTIDGFTVSGWLCDDRHCTHCASAQVYCDDYDAYFCPVCNVWLEPVAVIRRAAFAQVALPRQFPAGDESGRPPTWTCAAWMLATAVPWLDGKPVVDIIRRRGASAC